MISPHKLKYHPLYWNMALLAAEQSQATRSKVGAIIVAPTGMISVGWNGMPPGFENECEVENPNPVPGRGIIPEPGEGYFVTKPEVIHAERNAIDKMTRQGVPIEGSILFVTLAPCLECAKSIHGLGFKHIHYREDYRKTCGLDFLQRAGVPVSQG